MFSLCVVSSLNIACLLKHLDELRILLADNSIGLLAIYETRVDSPISDCDYLFLDMKVFVENVVAMADMTEVSVFMYDLLPGYKLHSPT